MSPRSFGLRLARFPSARTLLPVLQIFTGILTGLSSVFQWDNWYLFAVPWMVLNFFGILLAFPVVAAALLTAGTANLDWRSQLFFVGWFIAAPTVLSLLFSFVRRHWRRKQSPRATPRLVPVRRVT
jgi:hypothetical protein